MGVMILKITDNHNKMNEYIGYYYHLIKMSIQRKDLPSTMILMISMAVTSMTIQ